MKLDFIFIFIIFFGLLFDKLNIFLYCILSSLLHELGHTVAYTLLTKNKPKIKMSIFGFSLKSHIDNSKKSLILLISGPLVNIILIALCYIKLNIQFNLNTYVLMLVNLTIAIINLMPLQYLDGGRIYNILFKNYYKYENSLSIICVFVFTVFVLFTTNNMFYSLFSVITFILYFVLNIKNQI